MSLFIFHHIVLSSKDASAQLGFIITLVRCYAVRFLCFHFIKKRGGSRAGPLPGPRPSSPAGRQALAIWLGLV
jgi:hypothetical protein